VSSLNYIPYFQELGIGSACCEGCEIVSLEELGSDQIEFTMQLIEVDDEAFRSARFIIATADSIAFQSNTNEKFLALTNNNKVFFLTPYTELLTSLILIHV
jgi:hypothetical protein